MSTNGIDTVYWNALAAEVTAYFGQTGQWGLIDSWLNFGTPFPPSLPEPPSPPEGATITGTSGPDLLTGTEGPDRILGLEGSDTIDAAGGNDRVFGDAENGPTPSLGGPPVPTTLPGNLILAGAGDDSVTAGWGSDTVFGGSGDDTLIGYGGGFPSPAGFDAFLRRAGADLLSGEEGNDVLVGGGGNDTMLGGAGDDTLRGGYGADLLVGAPGADHFAYSPADPLRTSSETGIGPGNRDIILGFQQGQDVLDFSSYRLSQPLPLLVLGTGEFQASPGAQVRYDIVSDHTIVQFFAPAFGPLPSPQVPEAPTGEIELAGVFYLTANDFLF